MRLCVDEMNGAEAVVNILGGARGVGAAVRTIAELDAAVRAGFPRAALDRVIEAAAPESERIWLRNRVVPRATYQRRRKLSASHSATIERLARVIALVKWTWENDAFTQRFLWTPHPELGGRKPIEAALTELGAREVEEVLQRGLHGLAL